MKNNKINRKDFLKYSAVPFALTLLPATFLTACEKNFKTDKKADTEFSPDIEVELTAHQGEVSILPGSKTNVWKYSGKVIKGNKDSLQNFDDIYTGPVIRVNKGDKLRIKFKNEIDESTIVHWHGLNVPPEMDGHPKYVIENGEEYIYEFEVIDRAGAYWFHPHPHENTGSQVYNGLAGLFIITDDEESNLNLPSGKDEIPLIIQDRTFDSDNQLVYLNSPMERMTGFLGEHIVVNGKMNFKLDLDSKTYRLRLLNGSNSRIYKLALSDGTPFTVIGTDGGLLESPVKKDYLTFGPAERFDIIADFSEKNPGDAVKLISLPFPSPVSSMGGMMGRGMMGRGRMGMMQGRDNDIPEMGDEFNIISINIQNKVANNFNLPAEFSSHEKLVPHHAVNFETPTRFNFGMGGHMRWTINNKTFQMNSVAKWEKVKIHTTEIWEFVNDAGGRGMMGSMIKMPHPVHVHNVQFKIINRAYNGNFDNIWNAFKDGFIDEGWKDSFLLLPGTSVQVQMRFKNYSGMYLYHCHNLEHEDMGMMRNYLIEK